MVNKIVNISIHEYASIMDLLILNNNPLFVDLSNNVKYSGNEVKLPRDLYEKADLHIEQKSEELEGQINSEISELGLEVRVYDSN